MQAGSVLQCVAVCCSVLQCVAICPNVLQCNDRYPATGDELELCARKAEVCSNM